MNITRYLASEEQLGIFQNHVNVKLLGRSHLLLCLNYFMLITFELTIKNL